MDSENETSFRLEMTESTEHREMTVEPDGLAALFWRIQFDDPNSGVVDGPILSRRLKPLSGAVHTALVDRVHRRSRLLEVMREPTQPDA